MIWSEPPVPLTDLGAPLDTQVQFASMSSARASRAGTRPGGAKGMKPGASAPGWSPRHPHKSRRDDGRFNASEWHACAPTGLLEIGEGCFPGAEAPGFMPGPLRGGRGRSISGLPKERGLDSGRQLRNLLPRTWGTSRENPWSRRRKSFATPEVAFVPQSPPLASLSSFVARRKVEETGLSPSPAKRSLWGMKHEEDGRPLKRSATRDYPSDTSCSPREME